MVFGNNPERMIRQGLRVYSRANRIGQEINKKDMYASARERAKRDRAKMALLAASDPSHMEAAKSALLRAGA